jgi:hypothetical protein
MPTRRSLAGLVDQPVCDLLRDRESSHVCCGAVNVVNSPSAKGIASTARTLKAGLNDDRGRDRGFTRDDFDRMRPGRQRV